MPTSATGPDIGEHEKNKESVIGFLRWPLRVLFSFIISYLMWYFNVFGDINFIGKHANVQEEINATGSNGNNSQQISYESINKTEERETQAEIVHSLPEQPTVSAPLQTSFSPSFDCAKASTRSEHLICHNAELAAVDVELSHIYKNVLNNTIDKKTLKHEQNQWRIVYRDTCTDVGCILNSYAVRIKQLNEKYTTR